MIRRLFRAVFLAGLVAGGVAAIRALTRTADPLPQPATAPTGGPWPPLHNESPAPSELDSTPAPTPSDAGGGPTVPPATEPTEPDAVVAPEPGGVPVADAPPADAPARSRRSRPLEAAKTWVEPEADGGCPEGYPVKAKMTSKIFHSPGQLNYDRTTPDRCYVSAEAAEADGLRAAKR